MNEPKPTISRRSILQRSLLFVAGACGLELAPRETPAAESPPAPDGSTTLKFSSPNLRHHRPGQQPGRLPERNGILNRRGDLLDTVTGKKVGDYSATCLGSEGSSLAARTGGFAVQLQTLRLEGGNLFGIGSGSESENGHAILGGTGRFAGARGSYVIRRNAEGSPERAFEFVINLIS